MKWVTRERPKIDRIACPWLIRRFIDPDAEFLYVSAAEVLATAKEQDAIPFDVPDVELSHVGELCSFDAFLGKYQLTDPALQRLAVIVRAADTNRLDLAPQQVAPHSYAWIGPYGPPSEENQGFRMNLGFVVGRDAVAVIGSGYSDDMAGAMLAAIGRIKVGLCAM